jgi:hypothetical protein
MQVAIITSSLPAVSTVINYCTSTDIAAFWDYVVHFMLVLVEGGTVSTKIMIPSRDQRQNDLCECLRWLTD